MKCPKCDKALRLAGDSPELLCECGYRFGMVPSGTKKTRRVVALDFDGVIHSYTSGWQGTDRIPDPPVEDVAEAVRTLRTVFEVVVHSVRCGTSEGMGAVRKYLQVNGIEVDRVTCIKPVAFIYIDERGYRFKGEWVDAVFDTFERWTADRLLKP